MSTSQREKKKNTILVIEDEQVIREMIKIALQRNYNIIEASSCKEAIDLLKIESIDLVLVDYMLPDGRGFKVVQEVQNGDNRIPVIFMTAYGTESVAIQALRTGVVDYIKKPINLPYLRQRVHEILSGKDRTDPSFEEEIPSKEEFLIDGITMYIEENYMEPLSLEKLSSMMYMSKSRFCCLFKKRQGCGFSQYLNMVRIRNATELLKRSDLSITEIAHSVGYRRLEHFERVFKSIHGVTPGEFRRKLSKKD